jgi:hypothetical protein
VSELSYAQSEDRSQATKLPTQAEDRDRDRFKSRFKEHPVPKVRCRNYLAHHRDADVTQRSADTAFSAPALPRACRVSYIAVTCTCGRGAFRSALIGARLRSHEHAAWTLVCAVPLWKVRACVWTRKGTSQEMRASLRDPRTSVLCSARPRCVHARQRESTRWQRECLIPAHFASILWPQARDRFFHKGFSLSLTQLG